VAKKDKDTSAASQKIRDAEKMVQQRQAQKAKGKQSFVLGKFLKDFRGEIKKIIWPDAKTVLKNTGIVLVMVTIVGIAVYLIDTSMVGILRLLYNLSGNEVVPPPSPEAGMLMPWFFR